MSEVMEGATAPVGTGIAPVAGEITPAAPAIAVTPTGGEVTPPSSWTDSLNPDMKEYVTNKGFKDASSVLDSYRNLEKLRGVPQERLLKLPEAADSPEWKDVYAKLGTPATPNDYGFEVQEGGDAKFLDWAKETFHGANLTKDQASNILEAFDNYNIEKSHIDNTDYQQKSEAEVLALKKEWGNAYHQNVAEAQRAAKSFGLPVEAFDLLDKGIGHAETMKFFNSIGKQLGESNFHDGGNRHGGFGEGVLTPTEAIAKIGALKRDSDFVAKYTAGDASAREKMSHYHKMAYPDT